MSKKGFHPEEVLFSPTLECNLSCGHCDIVSDGKKLSAGDAGRFLRQCKKLGVKRVGFTGGEPFLALDFLCELARLAVGEGLLFDRIMTNAVWWSDENALKTALIKFYNAGYDGSICVSVDAFHRQDIKKVARFIELAVLVWRRPDLVSIAYVNGAKDRQTREKLRSLIALVKMAGGGIVLKTVKIDLAPVGKAGRLKEPWDGRWFEEDYCQGPGNAFFVLPDGDVKPCCGYATDRKELSIGNIRRESAQNMLKGLRTNKFVYSVFNRGLSNIRKRLERSGVRFPGKTSSHCFFCNYILTEVPRRILIKSLLSIIVILALVAQYVSAAELKPDKTLQKINSRVLKKLEIPRWYHEGLFFDGKSLWLTNGEKGNIWIISTTTGKVTSRIKPVADFAEAFIRTDDGSLFTTEWYDKKIYRAKLEGAKLIPEIESSFDPAHPAGLAWNGKSLFVVTWTRGLGTKFHLVELDKDLKTIDSMSINAIQEPDQLAWDGKHLWISSWYSKRVYKADIAQKKIVGYFSSPASRTTGIAWDGKYMWVTGTYDDLYQVEILE